jgi:hypothetical protein
MRAASVLALLCLAACERSSHQPCLTSTDCGPGRACLVDADVQEGVCLDAPGRDVPPPPLRWFRVPPQPDVLLVVDDGPGTAELQARLVASLGALVEEARDAALRVAVTTADADSPICDPPGEDPYDRLATSSCLDRLDDFVGADGSDARWLCTERCSYTTEELGLDPEQPWIDLYELPEGIDPVEALACLVPQGISGCEHAAPLWVAAQMRLAGALWRHAAPARMMVVTDGVDCSVTEDGAAAFDPEGLRALWSDPTAAEATAAVCWNAGVECQGDPAGFDDCVPVDRGLDGALVESDGTSVLHPLAALAFDFEDRAELYVIAGAPVGEPREPTYSAAGDPAWLLEHGIDPGCSDGTITALPPVRMRDVATSLTSACNPDYAAPLRGMLGSVADAACLRPCEAAAVTVTFEPPDEAPVAIPACQGAHPTFEVPAGAPACFALHDDSEACAHWEHRTTELVLRTRELDEMGAFLLEPNPWSPEVEISGCGDG